jgi:hypothetical protein
VVTTHHEELLEQAAGVNDLASSLTSVRHGLNDLDTSLDKLRIKIHIPYTSLQTHVTRLQRLQQASDVLRRTARFVVLARRLEGQMRNMKMGGAGESEGIDVGGGGGEEDEKERTIAKAALSIAELAALLDAPETQQTDPSAETEQTQTQTQTQTLEEEEEGEEQDPTYIPLRSITAIAAHIPFIEDAREKVTGEMQAMVLTGLSTLVRSPIPSFILYFLCN